MQKKPKKQARVDLSHCVACGACGNVCPREAIRVVHGCNAQVDPEKCVGCGLCAKVCPAGAVTVKTLEGEP